MDSVKRYKKRRDARLKKRGFRFDADGEQWRTTDDGHKILIEDGVVVGGNPFVLAGMGAPKGKEMPKSRMQLKERDPFKGVKDFAELAEALKGRENKDCIFGGFYKVTESGGSLPTATFYNPYTGEHFGRTLEDKELDISEDNNATNNVLKDMSINSDALWCWNRSNGIVQKGDTVEVTSGRTLEHGMRAKVRAVYDGKFGRYAYLDNGEKIQAKNVSVVDTDGTLIRSRESKEAEELKKEHSKYKAEREEREKARRLSDITQEDVESAVGSAKTRKAVVDALKKAGYTVDDRTEESGSSVDVRINRPDGTYVRVYKAGKELRFQDWQRAPAEKLRTDMEIKDAKYNTKRFLDKYKNDSKTRFEDLGIDEKYWYVMAKTASYFKSVGLDDKKAWTRAINQANSWDEKDYVGYGDNKDDVGKKVAESMIDWLKEK